MIAENENDLQILLNTLDTWCKNKLLNVNLEKTKVVHFRNPSVKQTSNTFLLGNAEVCIVQNKVYNTITELILLSMLIKGLPKISISWFIIN